MGMEMSGRGLSEAQKRIYRYFPMRPIAYQPGLGIVYGSVNVGLLLSQLLYWTGKEGDKNGWIYKTIREMRQETGLTRDQQDTAISLCKQAGILETKLKGIPAKRHFRINLELLEKQLPSLKENAGVAYLNPPVQFVENQQTNTEITHKTTSKNTQTDNNKFNRNRALPTEPISKVIAESSRFNRFTNNNHKEKK